ncbi:MAG: efflux RND transporter periplasmic adaptor subunit [Akkermansiaceae bacterium]|nr:efflux RND transporter periplasmic adaptor subunit [Akkermansiaceae bacterium]
MRSPLVSRLLIAAVLVAIAATGWWFRPQSGAATAPAFSYFDAARGPFTISLPTGGSLEAVEEVTVRNRVPGITQIISLAEEGSVVEKGDLLLELDSSDIEAKLSLAEIAYQQSLSAVAQQEDRLEVLESENTVRLRDTELATELGAKDLTKYRDGEWPQLRKNSESVIALTTEELKRAQDRLDGTRRLEKKGYATPAELAADGLAVKRQKIELEKATEALRLLTEFDNPRKLRELEAKLENSSTLVARIKRQNKLQSENARMLLKAATETLTLRKANLDLLKEQLKFTRIYAPTGGLVVYPTIDRWRGDAIEEGGSVRERQELISLPDISRMKVVINIYENQISLVKEGMPAYIHLDSLPDCRFAGRVLSIASMPEPARDGNPNYRVYKGEILITDKLPEIKPGITARVDVLVAELEDVIKVPVQSVVGIENRQFCFIREGSKQVPVEVEVGLFDNEFVEIRSGVSEGDQVALAPPRPTEVPAEALPAGGKEPRVPVKEVARTHSALPEAG